MLLIMYNDKYLVHPCEKVIGIFFRHKFFTIYFLLFVLVFIPNICEVVNITYIDFLLDCDYWLHLNDILQKATR